MWGPQRVLAIVVAISIWGGVVLTPERSEAVEGPEVDCDADSGIFRVNYRYGPNDTFYYTRIFALNPDDPRDADKDGLVDTVESTLALTFAPYFRMDSDENSFRPDFGEPLGLYQVTPLDCGGEDTPTVEIRYTALFSDDGGYGACSSCSDGHMGDNQGVSAVLEYRDGSFSLMYLSQWAGYDSDGDDFPHDQYLCAYESDSLYDDFGEPEYCFPVTV
ncbi:MAG: hypothetical protein PHU25_13765 [Deltaproteobacteria bacterium]|nr:hypothetical protein [Deltaproteobacteria bacterium]